MVGVFRMVNNGELQAILDKIKDDRKELWSAVNPEAFLLLKFLLDNSHKV